MKSPIFAQLKKMSTLEFFFTSLCDSRMSHKDVMGSDFVCNINRKFLSND